MPETGIQSCKLLAFLPEGDEQGVWFSVYIKLAEHFSAADNSAALVLTNNYTKTLHIQTI